MKLEYKLNQENYKELNSYMALHDRHLQKRLLLLMISLAIGIIVITYIIFRMSIYTIIVSIIAIILLIILFPKFYWRTEFKRIDYMVDKAKLSFNKITLNIDSMLEVIDGNNSYSIPFYTIEKIDFTKSNCMIFYKLDNKINTLIIPNNIFSDEELKSFYLDMEKRIHG